METRFGVASVVPEEKPKPAQENATLTLESLAAPGLEFKVADGCTVGRTDASDVVIADVPEADCISRRMALFFRRGSQWYVQHIGSTNYIVVDGEEYSSDDELAIYDGTVLALALCPFIVKIPAET